jgi:hypothetical protein
MIHVIPVNDTMAHHESITCPCNPVKDKECEDVLVHNAFDGREFKEHRHCCGKYGMPPCEDCPEAN